MKPGRADKAGGADRRRLDVIALGEAMVEFVRAEHPGIGPHYVMGFGGDTSNAIVAASRQGARAGYVTAIGEDEFGDALMELWTGEGIDTSHVIRMANAPTGIYFVRPDASGRHFSYYRAHSAASRFTRDDLDPDYIAGARVLHVSAISQAISASMREAVSGAIDIARQAGTLIAYDTNLRLNLWPLEEAREVILATVPKVDILFPSIDEVALLTGLDDADRIADHFLGLGTRIVALKLGGSGALIATAERRETVPPVDTDAVDSTGAGDAFAGAFLAWHAETGDPFLAARQAASVAARTVAGYGAVAPIPRRDAVSNGRG